MIPFSFGDLEKNGAIGNEETKDIFTTGCNYRYPYVLEEMGF